MIGLLPNEEQLALECGRGQVLACLDEHLLYGGFSFARSATERLVVGRQATPSEQMLSLHGDELFDNRLASCPVGAIAREEHHANPILPRFGKFEAELLFRDLTQEFVWKTEKNAGSVARIFLRAGSHAV